MNKSIIYFFLLSNFLSFFIFGCSNFYKNDIYLRRYLNLNKVYYTFCNIENFNQNELNSLNWELYDRKVYNKIKNLINENKNERNILIYFKIYIPLANFNNPILYISNIQNEFYVYFNNKIIFYCNEKYFKKNINFFPIFNYFIKLDKDVEGNYIYIKLKNPYNKNFYSFVYAEYSEYLLKLLREHLFFILLATIFLLLSLIVLFLIKILSLKENSIFLILLLLSFSFYTFSICFIKDLLFNRNEVFNFFFLVSIILIYLSPILFIRNLIGLKFNLINIFLFFYLLFFVIILILYFKFYFDFTTFFNLFISSIFILLLFLCLYFLIKKYISDSYYFLLFVSYFIFDFGILVSFYKGRFNNINNNFLYFFTIAIIFIAIYEIYYFSNKFKNNFFDLETNVFNKYFFESQLDRDINLCIRENKPISVIKIELTKINEFAILNGEKKAKELVKKFGEIVNMNIKRSTDYLAIIGKNKFFIVLPFTDIEGAKIVFERILRNIKGIISIKAGITFIYPKNINDKNTLLQKSEYALHVAKKEDLDYYVRF
jgi:diguanylate cyclase (GGDEF)-like protein